LWDFNIYCDRIISARRPDITIVDKVKKEVLFVDISVPADKRVYEKGSEKISKYADLRIEVECLWNMRTSVIPIVVGALGAVSKHFEKYVQKLDLPALNWDLLQKSSLLGTASILRQVLQLSGAGRTRAAWLIYFNHYPVSVLCV